MWASRAAASVTAAGLDCLDHAAQHGNADIGRALVLEVVNGDGPLADLRIPIVRIALAFLIGSITILADEIERVVTALVLTPLLLGVDDIA